MSFWNNPAGSITAFVKNPVDGMLTNIGSVSPAAANYLAPRITPSNQTVAAARVAAAAAAVVVSGGTALGATAGSVGLGGVATSVGSALAAIPGGAAIGTAVAAKATVAMKDNINRAMGVPDNPPQPANGPAPLVSQSAQDAAKAWLTPPASSFSTPMLIAGLGALLILV